MRAMVRRRKLEWPRALPQHVSCVKVMDGEQHGKVSISVRLLCDFEYIFWF